MINLRWISIKKTSLKKEVKIWKRRISSILARIRKIT